MMMAMVAVGTIHLTNPLDTCDLADPSVVAHCNGKATPNPDLPSPENLAAGKASNSPNSMIVLVV